jgi:hypothetical protein
MRPRWRDLAERAANPARSAKEVAEALVPALKREFAEAPVEAVLNVLGCGKEQASLFASERIAKLEALREKCRGSAAGNKLIDCAVEVTANGSIGDAAGSASLENAMESYTRDSFRAVEEHYQREDGGRAGSVMRERLREARRECDFKAVASDLKSGEKPLAKSARVRKRSGVDEGPSL